MKNLSLILNAVLLIAVLYLYVDRFSGNKSKPASTAAAIVEDMPEPSTKPLSIVYFDIDSLQTKSDAFQKKKAELEKRQASAEASMKSKSAAFQKEVMAAQEKAQTGTMTRKDMEDASNRLGMKEQKLMEESDRLSKELLDETNKFNEEFTNDVKSHLDSLKKELKYDYIFVYGPGSSVILANDSFNITNSILKLLNNKKK